MPIINSISAEDKAQDLGVLCSKAVTIPAADFDKTLNQIDSSLFSGEEVFTFITIMDSPTVTYDVELEYIDGKSSIVTWPAWTPILVRAKRILSANTTATIISVLAGQ